MPGMSPRTKAKKGIFGVGGLAPLLNLVSFLTAGTTGGDTGFEANAYDDIDGDLTALITWTSDVDGVVGGPGGTPTLTFTSTGPHVVTVAVTSPTGGQTTSTTFNITVA